MSSLRAVSGQANLGRRIALDRLMTVLMGFCVIAAVVPLLAVLGYVFWRGISVISIDFITKSEPFDLSATGGGIWNGVKGTIKLIALSALMAVPAGIGAAIYLNEYGKGRLAGYIRFVSDVMTGVPSIFVGVFVYALIVLSTGSFSAFAGAVALAVIMLPIVVRSVEEILKLVSHDLREASLALGVPKWRTILKVVLPAARAGIITGVVLSVARAAGETAPLLFTSFGNRFVTGWGDFSSPDSALPMLIFHNARSAYDAAQGRAWGAALVLILMIVAFTTLTRVLALRKSGRL